MRCWSKFNKREKSSHTSEKSSCFSEADYQNVLRENATLRQALTQAHEHIKVLEGQLAKNSQNSSKPPSSDGLKKPNPKSTRPRGERSPGGQKGVLSHLLRSREKRINIWG
ncbi:MAG: DUF6444 domain-containing protein, partial [Myxococcaceae bacterium]